MRRGIVITTVLNLVLAGATLLGAQDRPEFLNAQLQNRRIEGSLAGMMKTLISESRAPTWIGYSVPAVKGITNVCCSNQGDCCQNCMLEGHRWTVNRHERAGTATPIVSLETSSRISVLYRVEGGKLDRIREFSLQCHLDAGGLPVIWLSGADPQQSVSYLNDLIAGAAREAKDETLASSALAALAFHEGPASQGVLEQLARSRDSHQLRKSALFWLGDIRGERGYRFLKKLFEEEKDAGIRRDAVFPLSLSPQGEAVADLFLIARHDASPSVRSQAIFWLAHKAGEKVAPQLKDMVDKDPNIKVKTAAIFGLAQLPSNRGIPLLIEIARSHRDPAVRKRAIFWLGQSHDPRTLDFFESVLLGGKGKKRMD